MKLGSSFANNKLRRNLFIRHTLSEKIQYLKLTFGERLIGQGMLQAMAICPCMRACGGLLSHVSHMAQQLGSNDRLQQRPTGNRDAKRVEYFYPWRSFQVGPIR